jgi:hypothetical protein
MTKADRPVSPTGRRRNALRPTGLSEHECAAALVALLHGAKQMPGIKELRAVVKRAARAKVISLRRRRNG